MHSKQDNARVFDWRSFLQGDLQEIFVQCKDRASLKFRSLQNSRVVPVGAICRDPENVMPGGSQFIDNQLREIFIREQFHF